ncbi:hypothetical protein NKR23_g6005 [Pleurostoma richardsiae]|uniref:Uncharacterized protein n=1 Tax=Pleurostoma richardsiae TaxID=41990 RepID=A0AA38VT04_9PEZI|nr:hypothetical protein NKR23_g6005 [Pleurostoma richardsiae]
MSSEPPPESWRTNRRRRHRRRSASDPTPARTPFTQELAPSSSRLLALPAELRQGIISHLLPRRSVVAPRARPAHLRTLSLVCRLLRADAELVFFSANAVRVPGPPYHVLLDRAATRPGGWLADPSRHLRRLVAGALPRHLHDAVRNVLFQPEAFNGWTDRRWAAFVRDGSAMSQEEVPELPNLCTLALESMFLTKLEREWVDVLEAMRAVSGWRVNWWPAVLEDAEPGLGSGSEKGE